MKNPPNTVSEYAQIAAKSFVQTVVIIDDQKSRVGLDESDKTEFKKIVPNFARNNIICSLIGPNDFSEGLNDNSILKLCTSSDVNILDWSIDGDKGQKMTNFIIRIIDDSRKHAPESLRLLIVYSQEPDLGEIMEDLLNEVNKKFNGEFKANDNLEVQIYNCKIVVLGKEIWKGTEEGYTEDEDEERKFVAVNDLPDKVIIEFSKLASGFLSAIVLLSLANVKNNSHRILTKFPKSLDSSFFTHLVNCVPGVDAYDDVIPLILSELEAVLQDSMPNPIMNSESLTDWAQKVWVPGKHALEGTNEIKLRNEINRALECKIKYSDDKEIPPNDVRIISNIKNNPRLLLEDESATSHFQFSRLMCCRTFYDNYEKTLKLGTIVKEVSDEKQMVNEKEGTDKKGKSDSENYFLCIQPLCDCVRLKGKTKFLFIRLEHGKIGGAIEKTNHIIKTCTNKLGYKLMYFRPKIEMCEIIEFIPHNRDHEIKTLDNGKYFVGTQGKYQWVDQLKPDHAQRAVEKFSRETSRVGLSETGWIGKLF